VRTCVGCRERASRAALLRVVAVGGVLTPDPAHRLPGRGASVHPDPGCVDLAEKRRAFPRALRLAGPLEHSPVREHVARLHDQHETPHESAVGHTSDRSPTRAGRPPMSSR
jgi:predicted RNA-binding protein YlxR (DUF448 family)